MADLVDDRDQLSASDGLDADEADKKAAKKLRKLEKALESRPLDPWERYRVLSDLRDSYVDVASLSDRKTRFALIILGAVNAINLVIVVRRDLFETTIDRSWVGAYIGAYAILSLYFFVEAIRALRPRIAGLESAGRASGGLMFMGDAASQSAEGYYEGWRQAEIGALNRELAKQVQELARVNLAKFAALSRLYIGLLTLVFLTAGLMVAIAYGALLR